MLQETICGIKAVAGLQAVAALLAVLLVTKCDCFQCYMCVSLAPGVQA